MNLDELTFTRPIVENGKDNHVYKIDLRLYGVEDAWQEIELVDREYATFEEAINKREETLMALPLRNSHNSLHVRPCQVKLFVFKDSSGDFENG